MRRLISLLTWPFRVLLSCLPGRRRLTTEVSASLKIIETLERQIQDAIEKGTSSTDELCRSFGEMATRARSIVTDATASRPEDSGSGLTQLRADMSQMLFQVRRTVDSGSATAEMFKSLEADLIETEACIGQIENIANRSRMVSLNGQIEAARASVHGEGFGVVASETGDLAQNVSSTSQQIRQVVDKMAKSVRQAAEDTRRRAREDAMAADLCGAQVEAMLGDLEAYQTTLLGNLESTSESSDKLAQAITMSVMTLQFQDAVSQRLQHVIGTLSEIRETFHTVVGDRTSAAIKRRQDEWFDAMAAHYCVDDERRVLEGGSSEPAPAPAAECDVEFFSNAPAEAADVELFAGASQTNETSEFDNVELF